ncbi:MAG: DUF2569 family protein [Ignavibacteria bacterium]
MNTLEKKYRTLNGWLILVQMFLIIKAFVWIRNVELYLTVVDKKDELLKTINVSDTGLYNIFVYFELVMSFLCLFFYIILIYYMFKRSRFFPKLANLFLISEILLNFISTFIFIQLQPIEPAIIWNLAVNFVVAVLMIIYLRNSVRVKMTFVK